MLLFVCIDEAHFVAACLREFDTRMRPKEGTMKLRKPQWSQMLQRMFAGMRTEQEKDHWCYTSLRMLEDHCKWGVVARRQAHC